MLGNINRKAYMQEIAQLAGEYLQNPNSMLVFKIKELSEIVYKDIVIYGKAEEISEMEKERFEFRDE